MNQRFQFSLRALLCMTTGIGLLLGAESATAALVDSRPRVFLQWFMVAVTMHVTLFIAGGTFIGWAVGMPKGRGARYALYGACITALIILCRFVWLLSHLLDWFPGQQLH